MLMEYFIQFFLKICPYLLTISILNFVNGHIIRYSTKFANSNWGKDDFILICVAILEPFIFKLIFGKLFNMNSIFIFFIVSLYFLAYFFIAFSSYKKKNCLRKLSSILIKILFLFLVPYFMLIFINNAYNFTYIVKMDSLHSYNTNINLFMFLLILSLFCIFAFNIAIFYKAFKVKNVFDLSCTMFAIFLCWLLANKSSNDIISNLYTGFSKNDPISYNNAFALKLILIVNITIVLFSERKNLLDFILNDDGTIS